MAFLYPNHSHFHFFPAHYHLFPKIKMLITPLNITKIEAYIIIKNTDPNGFETLEGNETLNQLKDSITVIAENSNLSIQSLIDEYLNPASSRAALIKMRNQMANYIMTELANLETSEDVTAVFSCVTGHLDIFTDQDEAKRSLEESSSHGATGQILVKADQIKELNIKEFDLNLY